MDHALGEIYSGVFTVRSASPLFVVLHLVSFTSDPRSRSLELVQNSDSLWNELHAAGLREHDRFWRMPLDEEYGAQIYEGPADLINVSTQFRSALLRDSSDIRVPGYASDFTMHVLEYAEMRVGHRENRVLLSCS